MALGLEAGEYALPMLPCSLWNRYHSLGRPTTLVIVSEELVISLWPSRGLMEAGARVIRYDPCFEVGYNILTCCYSISHARMVNG